MHIKEGHRCKGCVAYDNLESKSCKIYISGKSKECPCITCIVKVMCNKACEPYYHLRRIVNKQLYKHHHKRGEYV